MPAENAGPPVGIAVRPAAKPGLCHLAAPRGRRTSIPGRARSGGASRAIRIIRSNIQALGGIGGQCPAARPPWKGAGGAEFRHGLGAVHGQRPVPVATDLVETLGEKPPSEPAWLPERGVLPEAPGWRPGRRGADQRMALPPRPVGPRSGPTERSPHTESRSGRARSRCGRPGRVEPVSHPVAPRRPVPGGEIFRVGKGGPEGPPGRVRLADRSTRSLGNSDSQIIHSGRLRRGQLLVCGSAKRRPGDTATGYPHRSRRRTTGSAKHRVICRCGALCDAQRTQTGRQTKLARAQGAWLTLTGNFLPFELKRNGLDPLPTGWS